MGLRFKILIGYSILITLLVFIVYLFRQEQIKHNTLQKAEQEMVYTHKLVERTYMHLWELTTQAELVSVWREADQERYRVKRREVCDTLQVLRDYVHAPEQERQIDTLCLLLQEKEFLLSAVMNTFLQLQETGNFVREKIPVIVSRIERISPQKQTMNAMQSFAASKMKKGLRSIFHRKESRSAYPEQREKVAREKETDTNPVSSPAGLLYSLDKEVMEQQQEQQQRLLLQMDSLYNNNLVLNRKLNNLVKDFEEETNRRLFQRYGQSISGRESSFFTFAGLTFFVCMLIIVLYVIIHRDVKRRSRYEKELEESDKKNKELLQSKKNMMLSIAHDLHSPLAIIKESAELLPRLEEKDKRDEFAANICHSSDYMLSLVNTLLEFYLLDTGQIQLNMMPFSLSVFFRETAKNYTLLSKKKRLRFTTRFENLNVIVNGDRAQLQQIINNLLSNALKFTEKGTVTLTAEYNNEKLRISVQDSGPGMTKEELKRIFNAFERLDNAKHTPGFGLGLAITSKLIQWMSGEISVESRIGKGSTFSVFLPFPVADNNSVQEETRPFVGVHLENIRVLVIDDDLIQQRITREMFSQNRVACDCCTNCWELTNLLKKNNYDLLLTDIQMPEMDGFGVLEILRSSNIEKNKNIPVIAVTARSDDDNEYLSEGFAGSIHKPFTMKQLMDVTRKIVGQKEATDQSPDFSVILSGEDNRQEMLRLFIAEARKDVDSIVTAISQNDLKTVQSILHKNLPLWETVHINYPLMQLRKLVTTATGSWTKRQITDIQEIIRSMKEIIDFAEHKLQEEKQ